MQRLLQDIREGKINSVYVVEIQRLARGATKDQGIVAEAFKTTDTLIVTPDKTYDPNNEIDQQFFEFENTKLKALSKKVVYSFWEKYDETHTVMRFATSWSTTQEDIDELAKLL